MPSTSSSSFRITSRSLSKSISQPPYILKQPRSPTWASGRWYCFASDSHLPAPLASTVPLASRCFASSGIIMPPLDSVAALSRRTRRRSPIGLNFIPPPWPHTPLLDMARPPPRSPRPMFLWCESSPHPATPPAGFVASPPPPHAPHPCHPHYP